MGLLCLTGALGHWFMIRAYEVAEASAVEHLGRPRQRRGALGGRRIGVRGRRALAGHGQPQRHSAGATFYRQQMCLREVGS